VTAGLAREILADELRRKAVEATLPVPAPRLSQLQAWYATYSGAAARAVSTDRPAPWLGNSRHGVAIDGQAPGRLFALRSGASVRVDGITITVQGESGPLGAFPFARAAPAIRGALVIEEQDGAFATWARRRENQALGRLACQHDQLPQPATVDLTGFAPFLSLG